MTDTDLQIMNKWAIESAERYNRRCRRLVTLCLAGRTRWTEDRILTYRTEMMRLAHEYAQRDLDKVWTYECERASFKD